MSKHDEQEFVATPGHEGEEQRTITLVAPSGVRETEPFRAHQTVGELLAVAVKDFVAKGAIDGTVVYDLVREATPLDPSLSLDAAHVRPGDLLKIRSRAIPSDGSCIRS